MAAETDAQSRPVQGAPSDNDTLTEVLDALRDDGFESDFRTSGDSGDVVCGARGEVAHAGDLEVLEQRRLEGASDPSDMVLAVGARCPRCRADGVIVVGYGPEASAEDASVVVELP